jgi:hypothetical protein
MNLIIRLVIVVAILIRGLKGSDANITQTSKWEAEGSELDGRFVLRLKRRRTESPARITRITFSDDLESVFCFKKEDSPIKIGEALCANSSDTQTAAARS